MLECCGQDACKSTFAVTAWSQIYADGGVASQKFVDDEHAFLGFVTTGAMVANVRFVSVSHLTGSGGEGFKH